nr:glycosyltransferase [Desulfobacter latus]
MGQGGAQIYVRNLVSIQKSSRELQPEVVVLFFKGPLWEKLKAVDIPVHYIGLKNSLDLLGLLRLLLFLKKNTFDIIHMHAIHPGISGMLYFVNAGSIYMEHGGGLLEKNWKHRIVYKLFYKSYDAFIAISKEMSRVMEKEQPRIKNKIKVIYNGVDVEKIQSTPPKDLILTNEFKNKPVVGIIGRLVILKDVSLFLKTAAVISQKRPDVVFVIIGDGPLKKDLEEEAQRLGIRGKTIFTGYRADAINILKRFDVFLFTSAFEAFGLVLTEAMAARVAVVALHQRGAVAVPDILTDKTDSYIVYNRDYKKAAERTLELLKDQNQYQKFTRNALKTVKNRFSMETNAKNIEKLYSVVYKTQFDSKGH